MFECRSLKRRDWQDRAGLRCARAKGGYIRAVWTSPNVIG